MKSVFFILTFVFIILTFILFFTYEHLQKRVETKTYNDIITSSMKMFEITSNAFENGASIPSRYTCDGENINPPLSFKNIPDGTKSIVLISYDPDVPEKIQKDKNWDHWIVFNIPIEKTEISENDSIKEGVTGMNSSGETKYEGPCPPKNFEPTEHRYFFKAYALDSTINLTEGSSRIEVETNMNGRILTSAELIGVYECN